MKNNKNNKIEKKLEDFRKEVKRMIGVAIEHFEKHTAMVAEQFLDLKNKLDNFEITVEDRFDALEKRMDALEKRMDIVEKTLREHSRILMEHSKLLQEHSKLLQEHSKILKEIKYDLKNRVSYEDFEKLVKRVEALEMKVKELEK